MSREFLIWLNLSHNIEILSWTDITNFIGMYFYVNTAQSQLLPANRSQFILWHPQIEFDVRLKGTYGKWKDIEKNRVGRYPAIQIWSPNTAKSIWNVTFRLDWAFTTLECAASILYIILY